MRLPLLQVRDLRIGFHAEDVVKGISFNLDLGEKLALVGESGSGKSVTALSFVKLLEGARVSGRVLWTAQDEDTLHPEAVDAPHTHDLVKLCNFGPQNCHRIKNFAVNWFSADNFVGNPFWQ